MSSTCVEKQPKNHEKGELNRQGDEVGDDDGDRGDETREVDLSEKMSVADEGLGGASQAIGEVVPQDGTGHVEEDLRQAIGGQAGDVAKDDGEDQ